jgi:hypothetical protein
MIKRNQGFICLHCGKKVPPAKKGKCRNHCNFCLYSQHIDIEPGDRKHTCLGLMKPQRFEMREKELFVQHECLKCGIKKWNKILEDDRIPSQ